MKVALSGWGFFVHGCTPIEDLITEDFGAIGTPERDEFERGCEAFIIWDEK